MNTDQIAGIIRAILAAVGGYLAAKGIGDTATWTLVSGAIITLVTAGWSIFSNRSGKVIA